MSIRDSVYTNPDALRAKYIRPKNVLQNIDEATAVNEATLVQTGSAIVSGSSGSGAFGSVGGSVGGGAAGGGFDPGCPALTEFVLVRYSDRVVPKLVNNLKIGSDHLWNPITKEFQLLYFAEIIEAPCYRLVSNDKATQIVSVSHPVIRSFSDETGLAVSEVMKLDPDLRTTVSCINFTPNATIIKSIDYAGIRKVMKLSIEGSHIYASGTKPLAMLLGHNNKPLEPNRPGLEEFLA